MFCIAICTGGVFTGASLETGKAVTLAECLKVHYTRQVLSSQELNRKEESETCVRAAPAEQALPRVNVFLSVWLQVDIRSSQAKNQLKCYCDSLIKAITSAAACCAVRTTASLTSVRGTAGSSREPFRLQWGQSAEQGLLSGGRATSQCRCPKPPAVCKACDADLALLPSSCRH